MKIFVFTLFLAGFAMKHMVVLSDYTCDGRDLLSLFNQLLTLKQEFNDYKLETATVNQWMEVTVKTLNDTIRDLKANISSALKEIQDLNRTLQETLTNHTTELQRLKDSSKYDTVGFIATTQSDSTCNGTLRFETTVMNNGSAYNPNDGYFTAPYSAMYLFTVQLCLIGGSYGDFTYFNMYSPTRNQFYSTSLYLHESHKSCSSMATTAYLSKNDQIYVTCTGQGRLVGTSDTGTWTMFTGVLVN